MLELEAVAYRYPGSARDALRGIDLRLKDGEVVGLVGPSEAGKSTLCLVASGLAPASIGGTLRGRLLIDGAPTTGHPSHVLGGRIGIVFADPASQRSGMTGTVLEEVALGPVNLGLSVEETLRRTRRALERTGLEALAGRDPGHLSGGEAQLLAISAVLAMEPRHLILDEPTSHLDAAAARRVGDVLRALATEGTSLLIAECRTDVLDGLCNRVVALDAGRMVLDGAARAVLADSSLLAIGVEPPARLRLEAALAERGLALPDGLVA